MIDDFYDSTALIQLMTSTQNAMGGAQQVYTTRIASIECRLDPKIVREVDQFGKITMQEFWIMYCDASTTNKTIEQTDRAIIDSRTFEVMAIINPGSQDHHLEIELQEIT